jgi:dephospho-CoA kinase
LRDYLQIAVTGGVACGKTSVCRRLLEKLPRGTSTFISCDEEVRALLATYDVREEIGALGRIFGTELLSGDGIDRKQLRELLFENSDFRGKVEAILHPLVLDRVFAQSKTWSDLVRISIIEVPLLYEVDFPLDRDIDLVVASSRSMQMKRLCHDRRLDAAVAERIIGTQIPIEEKMRKADIIVWNDGALDALLAQTDHLVSRCDRMV